MFVIENNVTGHRCAKKISAMTEVKNNCTVLESDGKKIIKSIDPKTYKLKFS